MDVDYQLIYTLLFDHFRNHKFIVFRPQVYGEWEKMEVRGVRSGHVLDVRVDKTLKVSVRGNCYEPDMANELPSEFKGSIDDPLFFEKLDEWFKCLI